MNAIFTIFKKDIKNYIGTPYGWVILAFVLLLQGLSLSATFKMYEAAPQREGILYFILHAPTFWYYFLFIFPLITMKSLAEEEKTGTLESLLTTPILTRHIVIGKYLAILAFYVVLWLPMLLYPSIVDFSNSLVEMFSGARPSMEVDYRLCDWGGTYAILFLVGTWFCALGIMASSMTNSQIIAGIVTTGLLVIIYFLGFVPVLWGDFPAASIFHYIAVWEHVDQFSSGLVDTRPVVFYLTATVLTLMVTVRVIDHRRWKH